MSLVIITMTLSSLQILIQKASDSVSKLCFLMVSVSKNFGIYKSIGIGFETFLYFLIVSVSVSKNFGVDKSIGIGFDFFWYRKKYRYRFRKNLVSKKVSVLVSEKIW